MAGRAGFKHLQTIFKSYDPRTIDLSKLAVKCDANGRPGLDDQCSLRMGLTNAKANIEDRTVEHTL